MGPLLRERYHSACNLQGYKANGQQVRQGEEAARSASGPLQMNGVGGGSAVGAAPTSSAGLQLQLQQHGKPQQAQGGQQQQQELPDSLSSLKSLAEAALPLSSHMGLMQQNHSSELPPGYLDLSGGLQVNLGLSLFTQHQIIQYLPRKWDLVDVVVRRLRHTYRRCWAWLPWGWCRCPRSTSSSTRCLRRQATIFPTHQTQNGSDPTCHATPATHHSTIPRWES